MADRNPLVPRQVLILAAMGSILWLAAAMLIRVIGPLGVFEGTSRILTYLLIIPGTLPFVFLVRRSAGLAASQHGIGMAIGTTAAVLLDGLALAWFPRLYGSTVELVAAAGAVILWGAGVGMALGFILDARSRQAS